VSESAQGGLERGTGGLFARTSRQAERVLVPLNEACADPAMSRPAFYCVHSVSGTAGSDFAEMAARLSRAVRFYGIQAPATQMASSEFATSVESIAAVYTDTLMAFQPEGAFLLGGHCAGAIVALAMADGLRARGREVRLLVAVDGVPENTGAELRPWNPLYLLELVGNWPGWILNELLSRNWAPRTLIERVVRNAVLLGRAMTGRRRGERLRGGYGIDDYMDLSRFPPEQRSFINRFYAALFSYVPAIHPERIVVYEAKIKPLIYSPQMRRIWRAIAPGAEYVSIAGNHLTMLREPFVTDLARDLAERIEAALAVPGEMSAPQVSST
jgi:thioesterase domain-containing protein